MQCQCPKSGGTHFYGIALFVFVYLILCQCPKSGGTHFYPTPPEAQYLCGFQSLFLQVFFRIF